MYEQILTPTDGSTDAEKGTDHAISLAAAVGATLHVVYVVEEGGNPWLSEPMDDQVEKARAYGQEIVDGVADQAAGVETVTAVRVGPRVHEQISEYADEEGIDLVVMGSGYRGRVGSLLGSTAEKVLRTAAVPVLTVRRERRE